MPGSERRPLVPSNRRGTANPDLSQDALDCAGELPPILPLLFQLPFPAGRDLVGPPTSPTAVCRSAPDTPDFNSISPRVQRNRSEEHTSELQSRSDLVCRLLLEKKNILAVARQS